MSAEDKDTEETTEAKTSKTTAKAKKAAKFDLGVGLDIGTMNLVSARKKGSKIETSRQRDCFLDVDPEDKQMLKLSQVSYVEQEDRLLILGDPALMMAKTFGREVRRPLSQGLISAQEIDALEVLSILIENVVGPPQEDGEVCYFSIPAVPVDNPNQNVLYHKAVFERILGDLGYDPIAGNEALAVVYSECEDTTFSGIGISFGSGMTNIAMAYKSVSVKPLEFSIQKGGDWIDSNSANALNSTASKMCVIKESGLDLRNYENGPEKTMREREALVAHYRVLIGDVIDVIAQKFKASKGQMEVGEPIPIVISGGTSMATGFFELFSEVFERKRKRFPIEISEIRRAEDPLKAVAQGLLLQARLEYE